MSGFNPKLIYPSRWDRFEGDEHRSPQTGYLCLNHDWADTGMKWTYCKKCNEDGEWAMEEGYRPCHRKRKRY